MTDEQPAGHPVPPPAARKWDTTPVGVGATLLGITTVIALAGWPRPTLYALAALTTASVLLGGLIALIGYRRKSGLPPTRPDLVLLVSGQVSDQASGPIPDGPEIRGTSPDSVRIDPDGRGCAGCGGPDCVGHPPPASEERTPDQLLQQLVDALGLDDGATWPAVVADVRHLRRVTREALAGRADAEDAVTTSVRARKVAEERARNAESAARSAEAAIARINAECAAIEAIEAEAHEPPNADDVRRIVARIRRALAQPVPADPPPPR